MAQALGGVAVLAGALHLASAPGASLPALSPLAAAPALEPGPAVADASSDAGRYRGGPSHLGRSAARGPRAPGLRYAFATGGPIRGRVALDASGRPVVASYDGGLYFLDGGGGLRIRRELGAGSHGGPVCTRAGLVVATDAGVVWLFSEQGEPLARRELGVPIDAPVSEAPDGSLWVTAGTRLVHLSGDLARRLDELPAKGRIVSAAAIDADGDVYVAGQDHYLRAFGADLAPRFAVDLARDLEAPPVIAGNAVFVAGDGGLVARVARGSGTVGFVVHVDGHVRAPMALVGQVLWLQTFGPRPALLALSTRDGHVLGGHRFPLLDSNQEGARSGPLVDASGAVFVGGPDDAIYGFDARGRRLFRWATGGDVHGAPNLGPDGTLYIGCDDGRLYALADPISAF